MRQILLCLITLISMASFSQPPEKKSPLITLNDIEIQFYELVIFVEQNNRSLTYKDTADIDLDLGETIPGQSFQIVKSGLRDIIVEQHYETSLSISDEGPHLDLLDWKHFTSDWIELSPIDLNTYKTIDYSSEEQEKFPDFTEEELIDYLVSINRQGYADLIANPAYSDGSQQWWIGLSSVTIRISGFDKANHWVSRYLIFEIPMGC